MLMKKAGGKIVPPAYNFLIFRGTSGSGEGEHIPDVGDAGHVHDEPLKPKAEAAVFGAAIFPKVQIPCLLYTSYTPLV